MNLPMKEKVTGGTKILTILTIIILLLTIISTYLIIKWNIIWTSDRNEYKAREFAESMIHSIVQRTEYYKHHCKQKVINWIKENESEITENCKIILGDYDDSLYEYNVVFDGKNNYYIGIEHWSDHNYELVNFKKMILKI